MSEIWELLKSSHFLLSPWVIKIVIKCLANPEYSTAKLILSSLTDYSIQKYESLY